LSGKKWFSKKFQNTKIKMITKLGNDYRVINPNPSFIDIFDEGEDNDEDGEELIDNISVGSIFLSQNSEKIEIEKESSLIPTIDSLPDYGQRHPDWISYLEGLKSVHTYKNRVDDFILWQHKIIDESDLVARSKLYFTTSAALLNSSGKKRYAPTVFKSWFSMFLKFWALSGKGDLNVLAPIHNCRR
jgi:hypothetical protein